MKKPQRIIHSRDLRSIDDAAFWLALIDVKNTVIASQNKAASYSAELATTLNRHAPIRERRVTDRPSAPWMSDEIQTLKADRRKVERRLRKTGLASDKLLFKNLTLKLNNLICNTKRAFYEAKISVCKTSKSLYELE